MKLPLVFEDGYAIKYEKDKVMPKVDELESFLENVDILKSRESAKNALFSHELKANNQIEGYNDDINLIMEVINARHTSYSDEQIKRIKNLYHGYDYILKGNDINKENLKKLYGKLSKDILQEEDQKRMGTYYRNDKVYILKNGRIDTEPDEGVDCANIDKFLNLYFDFLNNYSTDGTYTSEYIKSQILHLYFVYIHPYFDVNGRTSRTLSLWYLLNKKVYPYIIFNRGITFKGSLYDNTIRDAITFHDTTFFIKFMLDTVQGELEKEYIMESIFNNSNDNFYSEDWQTLLYLLSMKGNITMLDFVATYNRFHTKKRPKDIYKNMIKPLIEKNILVIGPETGKYMYDNNKNFCLNINPNVLNNYDKEKIKVLTRFK